MLYFAYGSNIDREAMADRAPGARFVASVTIDGWEVFIARCGYASIRIADGGTVFGVLWEITPDDERRLDAWEELSNGLYRKERISVPFGGERSSAMVYVATDSRPGEPVAGYVEKIVHDATELGAHDDSLHTLRHSIRPAPSDG